MESKEVIALLVDIIKEMGSYKAAKPKNKMKVGSTRRKLQFDADIKPMIQHKTESDDKEKDIQPQSIPTTEFSKNVLETLIDQNICPPNSAAKYPCPICKNTTPILLYQHLYKIHGKRGYELKMWIREARLIKCDL